MTQVRIFRAENPLKRILEMPGGRTAREALAAAETRMEAVSEDCRAGLRARASRLSTLAAEGAAGDADAPERIYAAANEIFGVAGAVGLPDLGKAAYSLCELMTRFRDRGAVSWAAVEVHAEAIALLAEPAEADAAVLIVGLAKVCARFDDPE